MERDRSKTIYNVRKFLNKKGIHAGAYILASIDRNYYSYEIKNKPDYEKLSHYIDFKLSDCDRVVSLDFDIGSKKDFNNTIYKIDIITDTLNELKKELIKAHEEEQKF